jgi:hypothetical protein
MENQKLEEKNMTTQSLINAPTYLGLDLVLIFFVEHDLLVPLMFPMMSTNATQFQNPFTS